MSMGQGGGGWGAPPGGGGWGAPPSGGGGWPAPPPGGAPPPHGGPPQGGWSAPGPAPNGETPLAHIPFTPEDERHIRQMAWLARAAGIGAVASCVLQGGVGFITSIRSGGTPGGSIMAIVIAAVLAYFLYEASTSLEKMITTDGADQQHLGKALAALRNYFLVKGFVYILAMLAFCCIAIAIAAIGASIAAMLGSS
jgi:hypothetical protein